jgi:hypothetical protein
VPRSDELDSYIGRTVRAIRFDGARIEGVLESVSHQDVDDILVIGPDPIRLGKLTQLFVFDAVYHSDGGQSELVQIWPESDGTPFVEGVAEETDQEIYDKAVQLLERSVIVSIGPEKLSGTLEAVSPPTASEGSVLYLGLTEGGPTLRINLVGVTDIEEDIGQGVPLTVTDLESMLLSEDTPAEDDLDIMPDPEVEGVEEEPQYPADATVDPEDGGLLAPPA